jgi:hypothetical protein
MNESSEERGCAGIHIWWPVTSNTDYKDALLDAKYGIAFNNISLITEYRAGNGAKMLWLGDLETEFMERIEEDIDFTPVHVIFASHHGRVSGKIPDSWLDKLKPKIVVIGEAPSRHLHYYGGYNTLTQNRAGDITLDCSKQGKIHIYASNTKYTAEFLDDEDQYKYDYYIGTLNF